MFAVQNEEDGDSFGNAIHVKTVIGGVATEIVEAKADNIRTSNDGKELRAAAVSYENGRLQVLLDGVLKVNLLVPLRGVLSKREVYAGFTAGTGTEGDFHDIFTWTLTQDEAAPTDPPDPTPATSSKPSVRPSSLPTSLPSTSPSSMPSKSPGPPSPSPPAPPTPPTPTPTPSTPECVIPIPILGPFLCLFFGILSSLFGG